MTTGTKNKRPKRDGNATREKILRAATEEFCQRGFDGARVDRIAKRAGSNIRMVYHFFGSKKDLYVRILEMVYSEVRAKEAALDLKRHEPLEGMLELVDFTFRHLVDHPEFIQLIRNENLLQGRYLTESKYVPEATLPLVNAIKDLLRRGVRQGVFRRGIDPVQLYISLLSLCFIHLSNRYTLSIMFQRDLSDSKWLNQRRRHVRKMVEAFLVEDGSGDPPARSRPRSGRKDAAPGVMVETSRLSG